MHTPLEEQNYLISDKQGSDVIFNESMTDITFLSLSFLRRGL